MLFDPRAEQHLIGPELRYEVIHIWGWWQDLHMMRATGMNGGERLDWRAIESYDRLRHLDMMPEELALLRVIELEYWAHRHSVTSNTPRPSED
jgi:hypothetical protein